MDDIIDLQLDGLSADGSDRAMANVFRVIRNNPQYIPKGLEILSGSGTDIAVSMIFITANTNPEYVPNGITALAESENKTAPLNIYNLVDSHPKTAHILQALDVLAENGGNLDVDAIYALSNKYSDFVPDSFEHLSAINTKNSLMAIVNLMKAHPEHQGLGLKTLKENGGELAAQFHKSALDQVMKEAISKDQTAKTPTSSAATPVQQQGFNYSLRPEDRLDHLAQDGSAKAVKEMYRIMTNDEQHIPKGLSLLGGIHSDEAINTIRHIVTANQSYVMEAIEAFGNNKNDMAPVEIDELVRKFPAPKHVSKALELLGEHDARSAVFAIAEIMKERPDHIDEGYDALKLHLKKDHKELVIKSVGEIMGAQPAAVPEGLVLLDEDASPEAMKIFDRVLEGITGVDLTSSRATFDGFVLSPGDDIAYQRFCADVDDTLEAHGITHMPDDSPADDPNNELGL